MQKFAQIFQVNSEPIYKKDRPQEVKHALCSADKARRLLNYKTTTSLRDGIRHTYEYIKRGTKDFDYNINLEIINDLTPETWKKKRFENYLTFSRHGIYLSISFLKVISNNKPSIPIIKIVIQITSY